MDVDEAVKVLLRHIGEDPTRDGLHDTPRRVVKALSELTCGYGTDIAALLGVTFDGDGWDEMVMVRDVPFSSLCEHHMLPFTGHATVAYIPKENGRIVGLSKLARLVEAYARRLQVQERLTGQVADALVEHLDPLAVGVIIRGHHSCMSMRGIGVPGEMVTSALRGVFHTDQAARAEFMTLARGGL